MFSVKTGVLLVNLGTPDAPTPEAVKRYLAEFLTDKRVIDLNRWMWLPLLKGLILPRRAPKVAKLYESVWTDEGAPLLAYSRRQQQELAKCLSADIVVELAMTYGLPSMDKALDNMLSQGVNKLIVLPLYPQYSSTTTGAVWDALNSSMAKRRNIPEIIFIRDYATHPLYINSLAETVRQSFEQYGRPDLLVLSYHGIPVRYATEGDDYPQRCLRTTQALVGSLQLSDQQYLIVYQSRFGKEEWLKPYADVTLAELPAKGIKNIQVICPGFSVDCLETLEEVAVSNKKLFLNAGGESYHYIPALNANPLHIRLLQQLVLAQLNNQQ